MPPSGIYIYMPLGAILSEDVSLVEFRYFEFTRMPGERYRRRFESLLLCLCDVFRTLIISRVLILPHAGHRHQQDYPGLGCVTAHCHQQDYQIFGCVTAH